MGILVSKGTMGSDYQNGDIQEFRAGRPIKLLVVMEATTVTGPAKNLIRFCQTANVSPLPGLPAVKSSMVTFHRQSKVNNASGQPKPDDQVLVQSLGPGDARNGFVTTARGAGIEVDVIGERFRFDRRVVPQLRRIIEQRDPDIIQTHSVKSHFLLRSSGLWRERAWVAFHHGYTTTDLKMRVYNQLNRWSLPAAHRVITVCHSFARELTRAGVSAQRISVLHNSVEPAQPVAAKDLDQLKKRLELAGNERMILAVGRLSHEKAHIDLINALYYLRSTDPQLNFKLAIVGDGPERSKLERAISREGLSERVVFVGQVDNVGPYYALADLLVLPSHSEGSPNVLLEAMAARLPIVATRVGGVAELVNHEESALLVEPRETHLMAGAIGRVLNDAHLASRLAASASASITRHYTPELYLRSLVEIYSALVPGAETASD